MQGKRRWLSILLATTIATVGLGMSAVADSGSESDFLSRINSTRAANGLGSVSMDGGLRSHARTHTQDMMAADKIYHSSSGELRAAAGSGWTKLGENVGRGGSVSSLHQAFMNSSGHRKNILGDYNYVGIGTGTKDGVLYVTVVFMKKGGSSPTTTTTTTVPQTTTTNPSAPAIDDTPANTEAPAEATAPATTSAGGNAASGGGDATTTTTTVPVQPTTTLVVGPDKPVTPGNSCLEATRFSWTCHD